MNQLLFSLQLMAMASMALAAEPKVFVPQIEGSWWQVAGNPDLGELTGSRQQPVDFAVWQAADGTWQLWSCIRGTKTPGNTRLFYRWEGRKLTDANWKPMGIAMQADASLGETPGGLQAPHVFRHGKLFYMFYGDWENICVATSTDGKTFTRRVNADGPTGLFTEGKGNNTRDAMVLRIGDLWHCYYTAFPKKEGAVFCRTSKDLLNWSDSRRVAFGGRAGSGPLDAECPFVFERKRGEFYLFRTQRYGRDAITRIYRSNDPLRFGINEDETYFVSTLPVAAPELIQHKGKLYIAALRTGLDGIQVARLKWVPRNQQISTP